MKKIFVLGLVGLMMASCGMMQNSSSSNQTSNTTKVTTSKQAEETAQKQLTAFNAGQGAGNALLNLYSQYKADGKYDYSNMNNIMNTVSLVAYCDGLKNNITDKTYRQEFGSGMIASSLGLVTQNNVETVTTNLVDMIKTNETVQNTTAQVKNAAGTTAQYASVLSNILAAFAAE